ncbi:LysR family transcriptional regulator [Vibrio mangrovi]|uniref:HTH-type transcriptional regulator DmlR n=1 Tax=Vibrio mangrovi TaxID=474394 RepID=A0A1Y6IR67_9VIBR|nr:LysR family transcriptional regulator [Vibrio mangrovi]MDW6001836.1 LysR family transcriptional regulator [Vibrio mangrovi]SMS00137.1 HTH-type transcriptional regulator DmlR [Vibrio mangrovi]
MLNSQEIEFFVMVASSSSLAAAARKLNVTPPSVSQRLQYLERKLDVKLVERSPRRIALTAEGEVLAEKGKQLILELESIQEQVLHRKQKISGRVKVVAPLGFGVKIVAPLMAEFQSLYPQISIDLELSDTPRWNHHDSPDVMIYIGELKDSSLTRIRLARNRRFLLASPEYLQDAPPLTIPQDLEHHHCIVLRENNEDVTMWKFQQSSSGETTHIRINPLFSSNVGQVTKSWALEGCGIIQRSEWDVVHELAQEKLRVLLPEYTLPDADIVALVSVERKRRSKKINTFIDFLKEHISEDQFRVEL